MTAPTADGGRRLKAIMFTDIKGFSAMMGEDEARTVRLVREQRDVVRAQLARHSGEEHDTIGDGFVVMFDSVVEAVRCGLAIQASMKERNSARPLDEQVWLRIGIHLGDIIVQPDGIFGDGVNVAARVESMAQPGGVCITEQVYLQIQGKDDFVVEPMGRLDLKNIRNPPALYRLLGDGEVPGTTRGPALRPTLLVGAMALVLALAAVARWRGELAQPAESPAALPAALPAAPQLPEAEKAHERPEPVAPAVEAASAPAPRHMQADPTEALRRSLVAQRVEQAMAAEGPEKLARLREAAQLDPENETLAQMVRLLEGEVEPTSIQQPARAKATAAPSGRLPAAAPKAAHPPPAAQVEPVRGGGRRIRPVIVED